MNGAAVPAKAGTGAAGTGRNRPARGIQGGGGRDRCRARDLRALAAPGEVERAVDRRVGHPGLLLAAGRLLHLDADAVEHVQRVQSGLAHDPAQRRGVRAVTSGPVAGDVAGLRRIRDHRAFRRLHRRQSLRGPANAVAAERVVAAGIEDDDVQLRPCPLHLLEHQLGVDHLEIEVLQARRVGVHRHQPVRPGHLHPVPGVVEQRHFRSGDRLAELLHRAVEPRLVEIGLRAAADQREAEFLQRTRDQAGVVARVHQGRDAAIAGIADHQRHPASLAAALRRCAAGTGDEHQHREGDASPRHASPSGASPEAAHGAFTHLHDRSRS